MVERFRPNELTTDTEGAKVKHFTPEENGRDRFGSRLFVSQDLAYLDSASEKIKAGILISPEGDKLIKQYPGLLTELDHALSVLESKDGGNILNQVFVLKGLGTLQAITTGTQSNFYVLTIGEEKFAVKTHRQKRNIYPLPAHQPYINEMLQTQSFAGDLKVKKELARLGVKMPEYFFASGQVSCTRFYEDTGDYRRLRASLEDLRILALSYLHSQKDNPLWENISFELGLEIDEHGSLHGPFYNFRVQADGTAVWVDPFRCDRPWRGYESSKIKV